MDRADARNLLSEYVTGRLDPGQNADVAKHLAADPELQKTEKFLRWLQPRLLEMKNSLPGDHATGEELVNAALGLGDFPSHREDWVRKHLAKCGECLEFKIQIQQADAQLKREDKSQTSPMRQWAKYMMAAAVAFALVASGVWMGSQDRGLGPAIQVASIHLEGLARGQRPGAAITPAADGQLPPLVLECDPWAGRDTADDFQLEIRLLERENRQLVKVRNISAADRWSDDDGGIQLDLEIDALPAGNYDLEIKDETGRIIFQTGFDLLPR